MSEPVAQSVTVPDAGAEPVQQIILVNYTKKKRRRCNLTMTNGGGQAVKNVHSFIQELRDSLLRENQGRLVTKFNLSNISAKTAELCNVSTTFVSRAVKADIKALQEMKKKEDAKAKEEKSKAKTEKEKKVPQKKKKRNAEEMSDG